MTWVNIQSTRDWRVLSLVMAIEVSASGASFQGLGICPGGEFDSAAYAVSADGSVIVGTYWPESGYPIHAFRWTTSSGIIRLVGGGPDGSEGAYGVSADGSVVTGTAMWGFRNEATLWTTDGEPIGIGGDMSSTCYFYHASGVSADGSVIVGEGLSTRGREAYRWTAAGLIGLGDLTGVEFSSGADGVSADGSGCCRGEQIELGG